MQTNLGGNYKEGKDLKITGDMLLLTEDARTQIVPVFGLEGLFCGIKY